MNAEAERVARAYLMTAGAPGDAELGRLVGLYGPVTAAEVTAAARGETWENAADDLATADGLRLVTPDDDEWPPALSAALPTTEDEPPPAASPLGLWVRGGARLDQAATRAVCIAGATDATPYGEKAAFTLGRELAAAGWTVITSGRFGIAGSAIRGALTARGLALVLPPAPLTDIVPAGHRALFDKVARDGLLVTESPPGRPTPPGGAIRQAQLTAALAAAVVFIEPRQGSIDRRLVHLATDTGRLPLAYPGPATAHGSAFAHHLIRAEKARLVASPQHVLTDLDWRRTRADAREQS